MKSKPSVPDFHQTRVLFFPSSGAGAVLVETSNGKRVEKPMRFADPQSALAWCIAHKSGFVYFLVSDPATN